MNVVQRWRPTSRLMFGIILLAAMLLITACQPIVDPALLEEQATAANGESSTEPLFEVEPAKATVDIDSLRVREGPSDDYELVAGVKLGESYDVLAMTSDGAWIQLAVDRAPDGQGWVSTEFVTLEGDITNIATIPAEGADDVAQAEAESDAATETDAAAGEADTEDTDTEVASETDAQADTETDTEAVADAETDTEVAETDAEAEPEDDSEMAAGVIGEALIQTPLPLRVRSEPTDTVDNKIGSVYNLETYDVLDISEDGKWVQIDIPRLSDSGGWIWWENVVMSGEIADEFAALTGGASSEAEEPVDEATEPEAPESDEPEAADEAETAEASDAADTEEAGEADEEQATGAEETAAANTGDAIQALIETPLPLRVRSEPTTEVDNKIGNVFDGETYAVLEVSDDGLWIKIDVPELAEDGGWVSAEYVILDE